MVNGMGGTSRYDIDSRETADHSLPYCIAAALVDGEYTLRQLKEKRWESPEVQRLMKSMHFVHDKSMDARFPPDRPSRMTIATRDGRKLTKGIPYPKGDYRAPFSDEELAAKFRSLSADVLTSAQQDNAIERALNFRQCSVRDLLNACAGHRA